MFSMQRVQGRDAEPVGPAKQDPKRVAYLELTLETTLG